MTPATSIRRRSRTATTSRASAGSLPPWRSQRQPAAEARRRGPRPRPRPWASRRPSGPRTPARGPRTTTTSRTRARRRSRRSTRRTVSKLKVKWRFAFKGLGAFGIFASTPIVLNGTVYLQDLNSNVYALDRSTGKVKWRHTFPNSRASGRTASPSARAGSTVRPRRRRSPSTPRAGSCSGRRKLIRNNQRGHRHDAPGLRQHGPDQHRPRQRLVVLQGQRRSASSGRSTPRPASRSGSSTPSPTAPSSGATRRSTAAAASGIRRRRQPGARLPLRRQSRAAVRDAEVPERIEPSRARTSTRTRSSPSTARPASCSGTGRRSPHDLRDYDLMIPAILDDRADPGRPDRGRAGRREDGQGLRLPRRRRQAPLDASPSAGTRTTPGRCRASRSRSSRAISAASRRRWRSPATGSSCRGSTSPARASATGLSGGFATNFKTGRGGLTAVDAATGKVAWQHKLPSMDFGGATVANDVVFTSTTRARSTPSTRRPARRSGPRRRPPASTRSRPSTATRCSSAPARRGFTKNPQFQLIAYSLSRHPPSARRPSRHVGNDAPLRRRRRRPSGTARSRSPAASSSSGSRRSRPRSPGRSRSRSRTPATCCTTSGSTASRRR